MMTKSGASLACAGWPLCNGARLPDLGDPAVRLNLAHRLLAAATALGSLVLFLRLRAQPALRRLAGGALAAMALEIALGGLVVVLALPMWSGLVHQAFGVLTFGLLSLLMWRAWRRRRAPRGPCPCPPIARLRRASSVCADVRGALAVLHWDHQVMMPPAATGSGPSRMATLRQIAHELLTSEPRPATLLDRGPPRRAALGRVAGGEPARDAAASMPTPPRSTRDLVAALVRATAARRCAGARRARGRFRAPAACARGGRCG